MSKRDLGNWKIIRKSDTSVEVEFPEGMNITGDDFDIEDLIDAVQRFKVIKQGQIDSTANDEITVKCCHGNTAIG